MENLKIQIKIEDNDDIKEAHDLLLKLGFSTYSKESFDVWINQPKPIWLKTNYFDEQPNKIDWCFKESHGECKEITLPELRDLVVLKRNDPNDGTHIDRDNKPWYVTSDNLFYCFEYGREWVKENQRVFDNYEVKPIEKPMKEYLRKNSNGTYSYIGMVRPEHVSDFMIEIPEGATYYAKDANLGKSGNFFFRLRSDGFDFEAVWLESNWMQASFNVKNQEVLWQRYTHPEELPFIDDEPLQSLNDQYAEIEKVRQSHRTASETSNPTIKETLNQRQSQYGSFEDVAMITEQMVDIMRKGYYENLAYNQKMALYMICSKMARIVNGDSNFIESWHDIAGYATLMENELRVTDGATNSRLTYQKVINGKLQDI